MADELGPLAVGVDVGGSGIKAAVVDVASGRLLGDRLRLVTPEPSVPHAVVETLAALLEQLRVDEPRPDDSGAAHRNGGQRDERAADEAAEGGPGQARLEACPSAAVDSADRTPKRLALRRDAARGAPVGVGFPAPVIGGVTRAAANIDPGWVDYPAEQEMRVRLGRPVAVANDADVAGIAEMRFGAGRGVDGTVMVLTIGTGIGSAIFVDGRLVPNTELGHLQVRGKDAEKRASDAARSRRGLGWGEWAVLLDEYLTTLQHLFWPDLFILGGGVSKRSERFLPRLTVKVPVVPATLLNDAGIVGAACVARERFPSE